MEVEGLVVIYRFVLSVFVCACVCMVKVRGFHINSDKHKHSAIFSFCPGLSSERVCSIYSVLSVNAFIYCRSKMQTGI